MIKVLVVDDHKLFREGIMSILNKNKDIQIIGEASSGEEAIKKAQSLTPHIILMDLRMPGMGGIEATERLSQSCKKSKVIGLSAMPDGVFAAHLLRCGGRGFLTKGASHNEVIQAIKTVHSGKVYISYEIASKLAINHVDKADVSPFKDLSGRELQIAMLVMDGMPVSKIAAQLNLSPKTVNSYRYRIFTKIEVKNNVELIKSALKYGILDDHINDEPI